MTKEWTLPQGRIVDGSIDKMVGVSASPIGWLIFNNPERRNAISGDMWEAMPHILDSLHADPDIRVIVVTGAGDKAFVSGADISEFGYDGAGATPDDVYRRLSGLTGKVVAQSPLPTIAMIRGACIGGGLATALNCDLRIAAEGASFCIPAARLGIGYPFEGAEKLVSLIGPARAKAILYTAARYSVSEALQMGLINEVTPADQLEARVHELASIIAQNAPLSLQAAKIAVDQAVLPPDAREIPLVEQAIERTMKSEDIQEGRDAFLAKRPPRFKGR